MYDDDRCKLKVKNPARRGCGDASGVVGLRGVSARKRTETVDEENLTERTRSSFYEGLNRTKQRRLLTISWSCTTSADSLPLTAHTHAAKYPQSSVIVCCGALCIRGKMLLRTTGQRVQHNADQRCPEPGWYTAAGCFDRVHALIEFSASTSNLLRRWGDCPPADGVSNGLRIFSLRDGRVSSLVRLQARPSRSYPALSVFAC